MINPAEVDHIGKWRRLSFSSVRGTGQEMRLTVPAQIEHASISTAYRIISRNGYSIIKGALAEIVDLSVVKPVTSRNLASCGDDVLKVVLLRYS